MTMTEGTRALAPEQPIGVEHATGGAGPRRQCPGPAGSAAVHRCLLDTFGFTAFRPGQLEVIERLLAGRSAMAIFPTGGGKSLCFQLVALLLRGLTLVVSPLLALMKDHVDYLVGRGIRAARLDSTLTHLEAARVLQQVRRHELQILYVSPERIGMETFRAIIPPGMVSLFVVDEAHCISEWGHNFRPEYLKLARFAQEIRAERVLALTAPATPQVAADTAAAFGIGPDDIVRTGFYRPNLHLAIPPSRRS